MSVVLVRTESKSGTWLCVSSWGKLAQELFDSVSAPAAADNVSH